MKQILQKITLFFKRLFFKEDIQQIAHFMNICESIINYQGYDLEAPMLDQVVTSKELENNVSDFVSDVIVLFIKRYFIKQESKYNYLIFIPSINVLNYIYDCFNHVIKQKKYKRILRFNTIAKNELYSLILGIINKWIYNISNYEQNNQDED